MFIKSDLLNKAGLKNDIVTSIYEDIEGILWIGTRDGGLNVLDRKKNLCINYTSNPKDPFSIKNNNVKCVRGDKNGRIWVGLLRGLSCFDTKTKKFIPYNEDLERLLSTVLVRSVYCDKKNNLWIGGMMGVVKYNLNENKFKLFTP